MHTLRDNSYPEWQEIFKASKRKVATQSAMLTNIIKKVNKKGESSTIRNFTSQNCSEGLKKFQPSHIFNMHRHRTVQEKKNLVPMEERSLKNCYMSQSLHMSRSQFMGANN